MSLKNVEEKVRLLILPHHGIDEILKKLDKYKRGTLRTTQFISSFSKIKTDGGGFSYRELDVLSKKYSSANSFGENVVDYISFLNDLEKMFEERKNESNERVTDEETIPSYHIPTFEASYSKEKKKAVFDLKSVVSVPKPSRISSNQNRFSLPRLPQELEHHQTSSTSPKNKKKKFPKNKKKKKFEKKQVTSSSTIWVQGKERDGIQRLFDLMEEDDLEGFKVEMTRLRKKNPEIHNINLNHNMKIDPPQDESEEERNDIPIIPDMNMPIRQGPTHYDRYSLLYQACLKNQVAFLKYLLSLPGINVNQHRDMVGGVHDVDKSALILCVFRNHVECLQELLKHPNIIVTGRQYWTQNGYSDWPNETFSPFSYAVINNKPDILRELLKHPEIGNDVNRYDDSHNSGYYGDMESSYNPNRPNKGHFGHIGYGWVHPVTHKSPLFDACLGGHVEIVKILLSHHQHVVDVNKGATIEFQLDKIREKVSEYDIVSGHRIRYKDIKEFEKGGIRRCVWTPLYAAAYLNENVEIVKLLVRQPGLEVEKELMARFGVKVFRKIRVLDVVQNKHIRSIIIGSKRNY